MAGVIAEIAERVGVRVAAPEIREIEKDIAPEAVLDEIEAHKGDD